jgi:hypothetical protein
VLWYLRADVLIDEGLQRVADVNTARQAATLPRWSRTFNAAYRRRRLSGQTAMSLYVRKEAILRLLVIS